MPSSSRDRAAREERERKRRYTARQTVHAEQTRRRRVDNLAAAGIVVAIVAIAATAQIFYFTGGPGAPPVVPSASASATPTLDPSAAGQNVGDVPPASAAENRTWNGSFTFNSTPVGFALDGAKAPQSVAVLVQSIQSGYYTGKTCHREVASATANLLQCGSLDGTGATDPSFAYGPIENAPADGVYPAGTIAIARAGGNAYSQGRQFFITTTQTQLPADSAGGYSVVGQVTSGLDAFIADITSKGVSGGGEDGAPAVATTITAATVS